MPKGGPGSERVLILAPLGRDAEIASDLLAEASLHTRICRDLAHLCAELANGAAFAVLAEEAIVDRDLADLAAWVEGQPAWSDFPIVLLTVHGDTPGRVERAGRVQSILGNITYLERPFHPTTLVSVARSALRSRRRQYEARASLDRYMLLARELQHRTKNLLAVIQSIATASLNDTAERGKFFARLHALAKAQDLLLEGDGRGASLKDLAVQALDSFGQRVKIDGPHVFLDATTAQGFALVLHELATNAAKHGALSGPAGEVSVGWSARGGSLFFRWREHGGPAVSPPERRGFGTMLLEIAVPSSEGAPRFDHAREGFTYELAAAIAPAG